MLGNAEIKGGSREEKKKKRSLVTAPESGWTQHQNPASTLDDPVTEMQISTKQPKERGLMRNSIHILI